MPSQDSPEDEAYLDEIDRLIEENREILDALAE